MTFDNKKPTYVVVDERGEVSWGEDEKPQTFGKFRDAEKRAKELAKCAPGQEIGVYELVATTSAPVGAAETGRKYPIEHYV